MKLEKRIADAARTLDQLNATSGSAGTGTPSRASKPAAKSAWSNMKPATITTPPNTNMRNMSGTKIRWYNSMPRMLIATQPHRNASASPTRTGPVSSVVAKPSIPKATTTSRMKGIRTYDTTPIATERPNHCEKLATKPR
jgi:hypothetical protein